MRKAFVLLVCALCAIPQPLFAQTTGAAPADEYFGRLRMSTLGMRNQLQRMVREVVDNPEAGARSMGMAARVEDAIEDLVNKYPRESWIEGLVVGLERYYAHVPNVEARVRLAHVTQFIHRRLPNTRVDNDVQMCASRILLSDRNAEPALCESDDDVRVGRGFDEGDR